MPFEYICSCCKQEFVSNRESDEESVSERKKLFPEETEFEITCEDCFIKIMDYCEPGKFRYVEFIDKH